MSETSRTRLNPRTLLGGKIESVIPCSDGVILIVSVGEQIFRVEPWSDEEGNDDGYLYVEEVSK